MHDSIGKPYRTWPLLLVAGCLMLTVAVYWPSLHGGYIFDDYSNIVENDAIHLTRLDWQSLKEATLSSPVESTPRPVAMATFALDWYFGQGSPFRMKVTNLVIHLMNGILVWLVIRQLGRLCNANREPGSAVSSDMIAALVASVWLVAPINFTAVAYVVQRMESLAQLFVLGGLLLYLWIRTVYPTRTLATWIAGGVLIVFAICGYGAKETALMLPLYAFVADAFATSFRTRAGARDRSVSLLFLIILIVPGIVGAIWALHKYLPAAAWAHRPFTMGERLLTESRIVVDYAIWTLVPLPGHFHFYHDEIGLSHGLMSPPTTIFSLLAIFLAIGAAWAIRRKHPLVAIGIGWFFAAQALTASILPLELVFEHRNYFASIGLYLALFSLLVSRSGSNVHRAAWLIFAGLLVTSASVTLLRAEEWSDPLTLALTEQKRNPESPRTAYELARTYVVLSGYRDDSPFVKLANDELARAAQLKGANALPEQGLLLVAARTHGQPPPGTWENLRKKLVEQPLSMEHIEAVNALVNCAAHDLCAFPQDEMIQTLSALVEKNPRETKLLSIYAKYAANALRDLPFAIELTNDALAVAPRDLQLRTNLIVLLVADGKIEQARAYYAQTCEALPEARNDRAFEKLGRDLDNTTPSPPESGPK